MEIEVEIKKIEQMRYPTLGDYYFKGNGKLKFEIADTGNIFYNKLILIHELIEQALTEFKGIDVSVIDAFDINYEAERSFGMHGNDEPGFDVQSPYHVEHTLATSVEMMLCAAAGIGWKKYEEDLSNI